MTVKVISKKAFRLGYIKEDEDVINNPSFLSMNPVLTGCGY